MKSKARKRVDLAPECVWAALADHPGMTAWSPGVMVVLEASGHAEPHGVGAVRRVTSPGVTIREQIVTFEAPHRMAYRAISGMPMRDYEGEVVITPRHRGSVVTWQLSSSSGSRVVGLMLFATSRLFLRALIRAARQNRETP